MKLSFSPRGWHMSWQDALNTAQEMGYTGMDIEQESLMLWRQGGDPLGKAHLSATARQLTEMGISIPCVSSRCSICDTQVMEGLFALARDLRCPYVSAHVRGEDEQTVYAAAAQLLPLARQYGVVLLIETRGFYADTSRLKALLDHFACDELGALWQVDAPLNNENEAPEQTVTNLGAYIRHVRMRDYLKTETLSCYRLMGEGQLPITDVMNALRSISYDGYYTFLWLPTWNEALRDREMIFAHYISFMNNVSFDPRRASRLYDNNRKTGKFIWKKDILVERTFSQLLDNIVAEFPDQTAFRYTTLDYTRTYSEFRDDVDQFARALIAMGVTRGSKVAVWATNVPQWYIAFWAATKVGAVLVTVNTAYKIHEAEYLLRQSDTHTLVMIESCLDSPYAKIIQELCPELENTAPGQPLHCKKLPFLRNVVTVGFRMKGCLTFEDAMQLSSRTPPERLMRMAAAVNPYDVCNMQYTSGTTGFPKGVMLTHHNIVNNGKCIGDRMDLSTADRLMIQVPMFHCFGMVLAMTAAVTHGTAMYPLPYFSPKPALACINQEKITAFHGVPTMFIAMLEHPDFANTDFSHMRTGIMAGSPCPISVMRDVVSKMNMSEITIVYGQTESSPGCTMSSTDDPLDVRVGTVGRPLPEIECKIVNPETGEDAPDEVTGEFVARGYNLMKGYYKMPRATANAIDAEGWLHTGDLACRTPDGNFRITGRLKDMIIRGGENIYPKEIEEFIYTHPKVRDVQVIGVPDQQYGEEIMACVILKEGESMTEDEMKQFVRSHMARHKTPRYVDFVESFPTNAAGKIMKYKMRENAVEKLSLQKANSIETA